MESLSRINTTFDSIRNAIKTKKSLELLHQIKKDFQNLGAELGVLGKESHNDYIRSLAMEGFLSLLSTKVLPMPLEEKKNLLQCTYEKLKPYAIREECLFTFLRVQNFLCYYLIQLEQLELAQKILEEMESMYDKINSLHPNKFYDAEDLFVNEPLCNIKKMNPIKINRVITNNIQMQACVYNKLKMQSKYAIYSHTALRRQLEMKEGTPQDWAMKTARLGNYFVHLNQLPNAHHHLCAAYHVLRSCHDNCKLMPEEFVMKKANFEMHFLEMSHHWVKYGLALFQASKKAILSKFFTHPTCRADSWKTVETQNDGEKLFDDEVEKDCGTEKMGEGDLNKHTLYAFPTLSIKDLEARVPLELITKIEDARKLFSYTHKWLIRAKHYYDFETSSGQYIACSLQLAELYEHLAFFERGVDNQYMLQKRRAEVLEALNALLKSTPNVSSVQIDVIRELSQVQLEMMALNLQKLWHEESHVSVLNVDNDTDSIDFLNASSKHNIIERTLNVPSKSMFLKKMEAASSLNEKLYKLSDQLSACVDSPSQMSLGSTLMNNVL